MAPPVRCDLLVDLVVNNRSTGGWRRVNSHAILYHFNTGGQVRPLKCDHARDEEVYGAVDTIKREQGGRLDLLVNNAFQIAAVDTMTGKPFWEQGAAVWDPLMQVGLRSHYVAACAAAPLLVETAARKQAPAAPAVINIGSFGGVSYVFNVAYGVGKAGVNRLSKDMAIELRPKGVACFSCWPGVVMTERMASIKAKDEEKWRTVMGVGEGCVRVVCCLDQWRQNKEERTPTPLPMHALTRTRTYRYVESPRFTGRAIVALLSSPGVDLLQRSGSVQIVAELAREFGFEDVSGARPPSIRSLQFLLPNYALKGVFEAAPFLTKAVPDWRLPLSVMGQRPD